MRHRFRGFGAPGRDPEVGGRFINVITVRRYHRAALYNLGAVGSDQIIND
jgi:hypothetical protein